jgi:hypothetical protein
VLAGEFEQHANDLVVHRAQPFGAAPAAAVLEQQTLGGGATRDQRRLEVLGDSLAQLPIVPGMELGEPFELRRNRGRVEQLGAFGGGVVGGGQHRATGIPEQPPCVTVRLAGAGKRRTRQGFGVRAGIRRYFLATTPI